MRFPRNYNFFYRHNANAAKKSFQKYTPKFRHFASAGFYYSGGRLHCCSCSLKLQNWSRVWNPLIAHSILNPECPFLLRTKGPVFIQNLLKTHLPDWDKESFLCKICYSQYIDKFLQCGHLFCSTCLKKLKSCPMCQRSIDHYAADSPIF